MTSSDTGQPRELFVLGSGRSGTTIVLRALTCLDGTAAVPRLAGRIPWTTPVASRMTRYGLGLASWTRPSSESTALFAEAGLTQALQSSLGRSIGPSDAARLDMPALHRRLQQVRHHSGATTAVVKNTASCGRVPILADEFPRAGFVHVMRNPATVVMSMLRTSFWSDMTLWWDGRTSQQYGHDQGLSQEQVSARHWARQVDTAMTDLRRCAPNRTVNLRYEEFVDAPSSTLGQLELLGFRSSTRPDTARRLTALGIQGESARRVVTDEVAEAVRSECNEVAAKWRIPL